MWKFMFKIIVVKTVMPYFVYTSNIKVIMDN